ncbi:MAG: bifunctional DNA primase/polymerase [Gemmatimonadaceae bacterium]
MNITLSELGQAAEKYAERGLFLFPIWPRGKEPMNGKGGHKLASCDPMKTRATWTRHPRANIGCPPGRAGLCVLDIDGPAGEASARRLGLFDVDTLACATGRPEGGRHLYFTHPGFTVGNSSIADHIDVRCDGGYVLLPPSIHPTGRVYRWLEGARTVAELPPLALEELRQRHLDIESPPPDWQPPPLPDTGELEKRIRGYLSKIPTGLADGDGRNKTAFRFAAFLTHDMALPDGAAWPWVAAWNEHNRPPLSHRELDAVYRSARKHGRRAVGSGLERTSHCGVA